MEDYDVDNHEWVKRAATPQEKQLMNVAKVANDKWGPAVGIRTDESQYIFFGYASS